MKQFVLDGSNSILERGLLTSAFGGAHTKESAEFVLWAVANQTEPELKLTALSNLSGLGGAHPYLPAMIEPLWRESQEADVLKAVAMAMAGEAAPSSVELLLDAAAAPEGQDDMRRSAASRALPRIYRADAVPPLASALEKSAPGSRLNTIALYTISQIGDESAAQAVIGWFQGADSSAAPLVATWLGRATALSHQKAAQSALNPSVPFRSEENREAIRVKLALIAEGTRSTIIDRRPKK
ncbi:MAG: hypothetical protein R3F19_08020 [Verrucomicrobiales bacterium]